MSKYDDMSDEYLRNTYVPDVYQHSIYAINYQKLNSYWRDSAISKIIFGDNGE